MARQSFMDRMRGVLRGTREPVKPTVEQGVGGFSIYGGYLQKEETNAKLLGAYRWKTATDILTNVSIVAASVRFMLNLVSRPAWTFTPAEEDSREAQEYADFANDVINDIDTSWTRIVRRAALYRYDGFGMHEWVAKNRADGLIGIASLEPRPVKTITRWDIDKHGGVLGVWQTDPQTQKELYLPRAKLLYLVDDGLTDHPDGMGWFRHLVDPAERLKSLLLLEAIGFERDLRGIPVGRAPISVMNNLVKSGDLTEAQMTDMLTGMKGYVSMERKTFDTGIVLDSKPYENRTDTGINQASAMMWDLDLLTGEAGSLEELDRAIKRLATDMAMIMGTEVMLVGREGEGSRALSEDKSRNLYLNANSILADMAEGVDRDVIGTVWKMNGLPEEMKPTANYEDVTFKDAKEMAETLADMATAGAVLPPDDPAFDDIRAIMGLPKTPPLDEEMLAAMQGRQAPGEEEPGAEQGGTADDAGEPGKRTEKYNPGQERWPAGHPQGGQWRGEGAAGEGDEGPAVLFEIAPNPDNEKLKERWNSLTDEERQAITDDIAKEFTPEILDVLGVEAEVESTIGGFEGQINPSLALQVEPGAEFEVAGALGHAFSQKAMVVASAVPGAGLSEVGVAGVLAPGATTSQLREMQTALGEIGDGGWTYRDGRMEFLNFSGMSNDDFAAEIDKRLGGNYIVQQTSLYSAYIEESDYASGESISGEVPWGQVRGDVRARVSQALEERIAEVGKAGGQSPEALKAFDLPDPFTIS